MRMPQNQRISDLLLEQYALGELPPEQERRVREELERDEGLKARLEALAESDREILALYPPERVAPAIRERLLRGEAARAAKRWAVPPLAIALPAAAVVLLFLSFFVARERMFTNETRLKGVTPHLSVYRKTAQGAEELSAGSLARRGDVLQLGYTPGEARYGVIFSVDGRGAVTWHLPAGYTGGSRTAPALEGQGQIVLPSAYELDDAPGFERFILAYASKPFDIGDVAKAARGLASRPKTADREGLSLPAGVGQFTLVLRKQGLGQ